MEQFVANAPLANPRLNFAIANVPQRSFIEGRQDLVNETTRYNHILTPTLTKLDWNTSLVKLVDFAGNCSCQPAGCPAEYDEPGLHPNALGEYEIAHAFSADLHDAFGYGTGYLKIPKDIPQRDVSVPNNFTAYPFPMGVELLWTSVFGVVSYGVRCRITDTTDWRPTYSPANLFVLTSTAGISHDFQIRSEYGNPEQGGVYGNVQAFPTSNGVQIGWDAVSDVVEYAVLLWDRDAPGTFPDVHGVRNTSIAIENLNVGHRYDVILESWGGPGEEGLPGPSVPVLVGGGTPDSVTDLQATTIDLTDVEVTWDAVSGAAGYRVFANEHATAGGQQDVDGTIVETNSWNSSEMSPGAWHFTICVESVNGGLVSGQMCVTPPATMGR